MGVPTALPAGVARQDVLTFRTERQPIDSVLPGFRLHPLDPGWTPLQAFVMIKALDENGESGWSFRTSESLNLEELLGALTVQVDLLRKRLLANWSSDDDN
jgi:hypothetical protein